MAEDDTLNAILANAVMESLGCEVVTVGTGSDAVEAVRQQAFDIVLMDFHMPVMDGLSATRAIRQWEADTAREHRPHQRERVPIIAITASAMEAERKECLRSGMDDVLVKPFLLDELREKLAKWSP
jgi:CheY-like chemotaxis protein